MAFKYELDELVYHMHHNKVCLSKVLSRQIVEHSTNTDHYAAQIKNFGSDKEVYMTSLGVYSADELFATKEELLKSL
jgi:hypothetical protein